MSNQATNVSQCPHASSAAIPPSGNGQIEGTTSSQTVPEATPELSDLVAAQLDPEAGFNGA